MPSVDHRLGNHLFEMAVAVSWIIVGLAVLKDHDVVQLSPVGRSVGVFSTIWAVFYVVGGPMILAGLVRGHLGLRVGGLIILGAGLVMNGTAGILYGEDYRIFVYFIYAAVCGLRAWIIWRLARRG